MSWLMIAGRAAVPVRLIPFLTHGNWPPDVIARILAGEAAGEVLGHEDAPLFLMAWARRAGGRPAPLVAQEWDAIVRTLEDLEGLPYGKWRRQALAALPPGTFVWRDELESVYSRAFSPERWQRLDERGGDRTLDFDPYLAPELLDVIYQGFEDDRAAAPDRTRPKPSPAIQARASPAVQDANRFVRRGDYWRVTFHGETHFFRDSKGLRYIALLLRQPGQAIHVAELYYTLNPPANAGQVEVTRPNITADPPTAEALSIGDLGDAGELLTPAGKQRLKRRLAALQDQIEEALARGDEARQARFQDEHARILGHLRAELGLGGRPRRASSILERQRKAVTKRIQKDIARLATQCPDLGHHLAQALKTGTHCQYTPRPNPNWQFNPD